MPPVHNFIDVTAPDAGAVLSRPTALAVGMQLTKLQSLVHMAGDEDAPHFLPDVDPTTDGRASRSVDGTHWYRPHMRLARRPDGGPDVAFLRDGDGVVRLQFVLEEVRPASVPAAAQPFAVRVDALALVWGGDRFAFATPTLELDDAGGDDSPRFALRSGAVLEPGDVSRLHAAMTSPSSGAHLDVRLSYGYWVDSAAPPPLPVPPVRRPSRPPVAEPPPPRPPASGPVRHPLAIDSVAILRRLPADAVVAPIGARGGAASLSATPAAAAATAPRAAATTVALGPVMAATQLSPDVFLRADAIRVLTTAARQRERKPDFHRATIHRTVPFTFDPSLAQHRSVYRGIEAPDELDDWESTPFGIVKRAGVGNAVFRIPDELRLLFDARLGTPHLVPTVYQDAEGQHRVRVLLRAVPWHDPTEVVGLRDTLETAPQVLVGGYDAATLRLTGAFPEQLQALGGQDVAVTLENGVELTFDVTLEFYRFLCDLLVKDLGISGAATVAYRAAPASGDEAARAAQTGVNVRLTLSDVGDLPLEVRVPTETLSPTTVEVVNRAGVAMRLGGCVPRLLQHDPNSVTPLGVFRATCTTTFPLELAPDESATLELVPDQPHEGQFWNAVLVEMIDQELVDDPAAVLDRIHELAPAHTLAWTVDVECPVFLRDPLPPSFADLHQVEVEIVREGYATQEVRLDPGQARRTVTMKRTLADIAASSGETVPEFSYRVRNVYFTHLGRWSELRAEQGSLVVFPNPAEGDGP